MKPDHFPSPWSIDELSDPMGPCESESGARWFSLTLKLPWSALRAEQLADDNVGFKRTQGVTNA